MLLVNLTATTDVNGTYVFADVAPGHMRLVAAPPGRGFASQTRDVEVRAGAVNVVDFELRKLPVPNPRTDVRPFNGVIGCSLPGGANCDPAGGGQTHPFDVGEGLAAIVVEVRWGPTLPGTAAQVRAELRAATSAACGLPYASKAGASILKVEVDDGFPLHGGRQCLRVTLPSDQAAAQQSYEAWVSLFYYSMPADDYTAVS